MAYDHAPYRQHPHNVSMHNLTKLEEYFVYQWLYNFLDDSVKFTET